MEPSRAATRQELRDEKRTSEFGKKREVERKPPSLYDWSLPNWTGDTLAQLGGLTGSGMQADAMELDTHSLPHRSVLRKNGAHI